MGRLLRLLIPMLTVAVLLLPAMPGAVIAVEAGGASVDIDSYEAADDGFFGPYSGPILTQGQSYLVTVSGTFSLWAPGQWGDWTGSTATNVCAGTPEQLPFTPSPGVPENGPVGNDAEYGFAYPIDSSPCPDGTPVAPLPDQTGGLQISLDGGATFSHVEPLNPAYNPDHTYDYQVIGQGKAVQFRRPDDPTSDNYGVLTATVLSDVQLIAAPIGESVVPLSKQRAELFLGLQEDVLPAWKIYRAASFLRCLASSPEAPVASVCAASSLDAEELWQGAGRIAEQLRDDPPRYDYEQTFELGPRRHVKSGDYSPFARAWARFLTDLNDYTSLEEASIATLERLQGAVAEDEVPNIVLQGEALINLLDLLQDNHEELLEDFKALGNEFEDILDEDLDEDFQWNLARLSAQGLSLDQRQRLEDAGATEEDIQAIDSLFVGLHGSYCEESIEQGTVQWTVFLDDVNPILEETSAIVEGVIEGLSTDLGPRDLKQGAIDSLSMQAGASQRFKKAIKEIEKSLDPALWATIPATGSAVIDPIRLDPQHGKKVFDHDRHAVKELMLLFKGFADDKCGGVSSITLEYTGLDPVTGEAFLKDISLGTFAVSADAPLFEVAATAETGRKLHPEIRFMVGGKRVARINTSCARPIDIGDVHGPFMIEDLDKLPSKNGAKRRFSPAALEGAQVAIDDLVTADRVLAQVLLDENNGLVAVSPGNRDKLEKELQKARDELVKGDADRDSMRPDDAIQHYRKAWQYTGHAVEQAARE